MEADGSRGSGSGRDTSADRRGGRLAVTRQVGQPPGSAVVWQDAGMPRIDIEALEDEWEEDHHLLTRRSRDLSVAARERIDALEIARVVGVDRGRVTIVDRGEVTEARFAGTMRGEKAAVGDRVKVRPAKHAGDEPRIVEVLPRDTVLTRTADDTDDTERVVVANADQIVIVVAADHLDVGTRFLDRVLVAASLGGVDPVLCINKRDLVGDGDEVAEVIARYEAIGVPVRVTSAVTGEGMDALELLLAGCWTAFTGHSGVGKSSLFNRLIPGASQTIGELGRYGGRHTTVAAWALEAPGLDAWLVDTPGVRSFGLGSLPPAELGRHFPELAALHCQLDDCSHSGEPGCELPRAEIHPTRLAAFERLRASLAEDP
jgi:ribosome biogenesis GTPase / thiamine phosphate phosphatase